MNRAAKAEKSWANGLAMPLVNVEYGSAFSWIFGKTCFKFQGIVFVAEQSSLPNLHMKTSLT